MELQHQAHLLQTYCRSAEIVSIVKAKKEQKVMTSHTLAIDILGAGSGRTEEVAWSYVQTTLSAGALSVYF